MADHGIVEERRLAYVAVTRARTDLLLTAHVWGTASTPRITSRFLDEVQVSGLVAAAGPWADLPPLDDPKPQNPRTAQEVSVAWPTLDHRERRAALLAPARAVSDALADAVAAGPAVDPPAAGRWDGEIRMLLDERARRRSGAPVDVALPAHLSTSALVALAEDAERFTLGLRRPMPTPPALGRPARHGLPRLGRGALLTGGVRRRRRAARARPTTTPSDTRPARPCASASWPASGPTARRSRSRRASRRSSTASPCAGGSTRSSRRSRADGEPGWVVVDWKTGAPASGARAAARALQLSAYRLAWARVRGVPEHRVRGAFFHAATGETVWPSLPGAQEITRVLGAARPT